MTTSVSQKSLCVKCGYITAIFTCQGCNQDFCTRHAFEHRQELGTQLDELTADHDRFRQNIMEQVADSRLHPLIKQIDEWEQQSIDRIHQAADDARKQLQNTVSGQKTKLTEALVKIADELRKAREDEDFSETDLKGWIQKLDQLKEDSVHPPNIKIQLENNTLIPKFVATLLVSSNERFGQSIGTVVIEDNGQVVVKGQDKSHATVRGSGEYNSGQHRFRFRIEEGGNTWILIGISSKCAFLQTRSYINRSTYGWAGYNQVYRGGSYKNGVNGYNSDIETNDVIELFIDCDERIIRLTNERTRSVNELQIDMINCPFPWQLNFDLCCPNDRVRILQT